MSERIKGALYLVLTPNGMIGFMFRRGGSGPASRTLSAKNVETAEEDLVRSWGFTPNKARVTIEELKMSGLVYRETDVDAAMVAKLFPS